RWLAADPLLPPTPDALLHDLASLRIRRSWDYGAEALGHFLWWKSGLHRLTLEALNGVPNKGRCERLIEVMVLNRLADPQSKWGLLTRWLSASSAPLFVGLTADRLHDNLFYRALDRLWVRQDALETRVYRQIVRPLARHPEILYHDTTSTYFEGNASEMAAWGHAPDHRLDRPRVKWGMVVTSEGLPVTFQVFPGNTKDDTTVHPMRERLTRVFGMTGGIYVGDRGMKSDQEIADLASHGFHWILAVRSKDVEEVLLAATKQPVVAVSEKNEAREVIADDGRYIVLRNEERREEELATLARRRVEGEVILRRWRKRVGKWEHHEVLKGVQTELSEAHLLDLFDVSIDEATIQGLLARLKAKVAFRRKWAGWWVLKTDTELPTERVAQVYQELAVIERDWHVVKGPLSVRPLYHRLERRIGGHLLICQLALLVTRLIELRVREAGVKDAEGQLLTGSGALEAFHTVKANEAELPGTGVRRIVITDSTALQGRVLTAVGLDPGRFQAGWSRLL
ncbi:MAG: IS1634 family transposase, partial [Thermoplasmata archaeon]